MDTSKVTSIGGAFAQTSAFNHASVGVWDPSVADWDVSKVSGSGNFQGFNLMFRSSAFINDDCKKQLTHASFSQQTAAFDLTYGSWSSAVCPS